MKKRTKREQELLKAFKDGRKSMKAEITQKIRTIYITKDFSAENADHKMRMVITNTKEIFGLIIDNVSKLIEKKIKP